MFGLEGSGFILSVGLTLLIAGTIIFYVNNKFKETTEQLQTVMQIVQQVNSTRNTQAAVPVAPRPFVPPLAEQQSNNNAQMNKEDLISVSDEDDDSDVSSTTDNDEGEINDTKNIVVNVDGINGASGGGTGTASGGADGGASGDALDDADSDVDSEDDEDDEDDEDHEDDDNGVKNIDIDNASGGELDSMLLNIIDIHKNSTPDTKFQDMKVTDLRDLIKERGIKVSNLGKLKKNECIELLS